MPRQRFPRPDLRLTETLAGYLCIPVTRGGRAWLRARFRIPEGSAFRNKLFLDWDAEAVLRFEARREGLKLAG